ncbi:MAG TPA: 4'-phosphopantetheinyl transferase superfamily protein [Nostocaceae cyanobacterium]|nr:4'-phosphopantetheinyl transferase superfamily protein [Nostocaceae cyanobacterium]
MIDFLPAPIDLSLPINCVHIWRIGLNQSDREIEALRATLSSDEVMRADRFYFPEHRKRFIAGRGSLRAILGGYLGVEAARVEFDYEQRGKPLLGGKFAGSGVNFNLSHSQDLGLLGVSCDRPIGVDLEYMRPTSDVEGLAQRFFLEREYEIVRSLVGQQQQEVFFRYWTCKEAYLKATGDGIAQLEQVEISLTLTKPAQLLVSGNWHLLELIPDENCRAAVVVGGSSCNPQFFQF